MNHLLRKVEIRLCKPLMTFNYIKTDLTGPKDGQVKLTRDLQNSKVFFLSKLLLLDGFFSLIRSLYAQSYVMYATNFCVKSDVMILLVNLIAEKYFCLTPPPPIIIK